MKRPLYIFDLDGTLALIEHRRHFVESPAKQCYDCGGRNSRNCVQCGDMGWDKFKPNWDAFHAACVDDVPSYPVIDTMNRLHRTSDIWIFSGRSDAVRAQTKLWLAMHTELNEHDLTHQVRMRKSGDFTPDDVLKESWYDAMSLDDKHRLVAVFDDRDRIVEMWRQRKVACFQVAPGAF